MEKTQYQRNKKKNPNASSQYMGVCWNKKYNKWVAKIRINRTRKHLGCFNTELDAFNAWKSFVIQNNLQEFYPQVIFNEIVN